MPNSVYSSIRFGSEVYTWFMKDSGRANANRLDHMIEMIAQAGFRGIQPIYSWMGDLGDPGRLAASLSARGLELCAMSFVLDWNHEQETKEERQQADGVIGFLTSFPARCSASYRCRGDDLTWRSGGNDLSATSTPWPAAPRTAASLPRFTRIRRRLPLREPARTTRCS